MKDLIILENFAVQPISEEILALNEVTKEYGITLTPEEAKDLSETRVKALTENERIEIGVGAVEGIIKRFSRSSYITKENYAYVLSEIAEVFYYIKTETDDKVSDNALLDELFIRFEQRCRGSIDTLLAKEAEIIVRKVNAGENYQSWFGERDAEDNSRDTALQARRDETGAIAPVLTTDEGDVVELSDRIEEEQTYGFKIKE